MGGARKEEKGYSDEKRIAIIAKSIRRPYSQVFEPVIG